VANDKRHELIRLIYEEKISIRQAALKINISYPTAKAINRIYKQENRVDKKAVRQRRSKAANIKQHSENNDTLFEANGNLADKIRAYGKGQLRRLDVGQRDMSHHANDCSTGRQHENQEIHWAEKSTPLLGRRSRRGASPISDEDDDGTLSILPPPVKRSKTLQRAAAFKAYTTSAAASEVRTSFESKAASTELAEVHPEDVSTTPSYQKYKAYDLEGL